MSDWKLSNKDRKTLERMRRQSSHGARVHRRVQVLLLVNQGHSRPSIEELTGVSIPTIGRLKRNYKKAGVDCVYEKSRPGRPRVYSEFERTKVIALCCSPPGPAHAQWTVRLLSEQTKISKSTVGLILKETNHKPWLQKNVVSANAHR